MTKWLYPLTASASRTSSQLNRIECTKHLRLFSDVCWSWWHMLRWGFLPYSMWLGYRWCIWAWYFWVNPGVGNWFSDSSYPMKQRVHLLFNWSWYFMCQGNAILLIIYHVECLRTRLEHLCQSNWLNYIGEFIIGNWIVISLEEIELRQRVLCFICYQFISSSFPLRRGIQIISWIHCN